MRTISITFPAVLRSSGSNLQHDRRLNISSVRTAQRYCDGLASAHEHAIFINATGVLRTMQNNNILWINIITRLRLHRVILARIRVYLFIYRSCVRTVNYTGVRRLRTTVCVSVRVQRACAFFCALCVCVIDPNSVMFFDNKPRAYVCIYTCVYIYIRSYDNPLVVAKKKKEKKTNL